MFPNNGFIKQLKEYAKNVQERKKAQKDPYKASGINSSFGSLVGH